VRSLGADRIENSFPYIVVTVLRGVFTDRRIETAILLLMLVSVAVRMFTDIPLLLQKRPISHNILTRKALTSFSDSLKVCSDGFIAMQRPGPHIGL
jgi:hypothetical protein